MSEGRVAIDVPAVVRNKALVAGAGAWLDELPGLVAELERNWGLVVGRPFAGATEAFVAEAALADGTDAVLKLIVPRAGDAAANEITVLRLAGGEGCVRLLRDDEPRGALLLERLGRPLQELALPLRRGHEILHATAARIWRSAPDCGLPTGAAKGRWLGILMREDPLALLGNDPRERARWLAELSGLDVTAIWEWGVVERVSTGLLCTEIDLQPVGRQMLAVADRLADL